MAPPTPPRSGDNLKWAADDVLLQVYAPAAVVLNGDGDIVYISGRTGKYLEPAAGRANWNVHSMAREGLRALTRRRAEKSVRAARAGAAARSRSGGSRGALRSSTSQYRHCTSQPHSRA
jgi:two-component system, chemotaxis family, CheB/CheR fusion protein